MPAKNYTALSYRQWLVGAGLATGCGFVYLVSRPPLYNNDGYRDRLYGLQPTWFRDANPHHLLWNYVQALIGFVSSFTGHATTIPFQIAGLVFICATLLAFFLLLCKKAESSIFAGACTLLIAFSPEVWQFALQNRPYALMSVVMVFYLWTWDTEDGSPPTGLRFVVASVLLFMLALLQQAAVLLVPAAVLALIVNSQRETRRLTATLIWGVAMTATILVSYVGMWLLIKQNVGGFVHWVLGYAVSIHSPNLFSMGVWRSVVKSSMGIFGLLVNHAKAMAVLNRNFSASAIEKIYGIGGLSICAAIVAAIWMKGPYHVLLRTVRGNALFAVSVFSVILWSGFRF